MASNGVIHVIDKVLMPEVTEADGDICLSHTPLSIFQTWYAYYEDYEMNGQTLGCYNMVTHTLW